jgi:isopenicillin-N N-acyltransferase-like protein
MFRRILVEGGPRERGRQYGEAAREQVLRSIEAYHEAFAHLAGWPPPRVRKSAARFTPAISAHGDKYLEEIRGIAEGAGADELDVVAINVRTEIMFGATARDARRTRRLPSECSSFAVLPERSGGELLVGQTWDWLEHAAETVIVLEARQDDGPDFVTVVEAGLLAKAGMNSAGIALATNALVTAGDAGSLGVPYHVLLRSILDAETAPDALGALQRQRRASSANYLLADESGVAVDVEAAPGDMSRLFLGLPHDGLVLHTNHFKNSGFDEQDVSVYAMPDSPFRLARLESLVARHDGPLDLGFWTAALADHATFPLGVCAHPDPRENAAPDRYGTVLALVMEPSSRRLWLASGNPCSSPFEELDYSGLLAPTPAAPSSPL